MSVSHPSQAEVDAARDDPKLANVLYHDWESVSYDEKWSISFDERCTTFAVDRFRAVRAQEKRPTTTPSSWAAAPGSSCST